MFFIAFGVEQRDRYVRNLHDTVCPQCGKLSLLALRKRSKCLHLFFIPLFSWGTRYYLDTSCCGTFEIDPALGKKLERDPTVPIQKEDLRQTQGQNGGFNVFDGFPSEKYCPACGMRFSENYLYCPYCGRRL